MSNIQTELTGFWNGFHNWVTKNPGFYLGVVVGIVAGALIRGLL